VSGRSNGGKATFDARALRAIRRLLDRFGGFGPGEWLFDGASRLMMRLTEPLLILTDNLNEYDAARAEE
jgi:hypothetical protein